MDSAFDSIFVNLKSQVFSTSNSCTQYYVSNFVVHNFELTNSICNLWHDRLGHLSHIVVKAILNKCNTSFNNKMLFDFCFAYFFGKIHKFPFYYV